MRLITRKLSARLSARRRSRFALRQCCSPACSPAVASTPLSPRPAPSKATDDAATVAKGKALFQVGCSSCHGKNAEGIVTERGNQYGPRAGRRRRRRRGLPGRHRPDADGPARHPGPAQEAVYTAEEISALGGLRRLARPRPGGPGEEPVRRQRAKRRSQGRRVLPHQLHRVPQLRRQRRRAAQRPVRAEPARGLGASTSSRRCSPARSRCRCSPTASSPPQDKRDIIAYLKKNEATPSYGGFTLGSLGPVSEGVFAWLVGIGAWSVSAIWITSSTARVKKQPKGDAA